MKKLFGKIAGLTLGLAMAFGFAANINNKNNNSILVRAEDEVVYTLTPSSGSNNSYTGNCDVTCGGITWNITGNSQMNPWRIGGKNISNTNKEIYSKTAISQNITKVVLKVGAASNVTVNSLSLKVYSSAHSNEISSVSANFSANSIITFERPNGDDWTGRYYSFVFNLTISDSNNKFVEFKEAAFYAGETVVDPVALDNPTNLSYSQNLMDVTLSWDAVANASSYSGFVYKDHEEYADFESDTNSYVLSNCPAGNVYSFIVKAVGDNKNYLDSEYVEQSFVVNAPKEVSNFEFIGDLSSGDVITVNVTRSDTSVLAPAVYYLLKFNDNSYGEAVLSWDNNDGLDNVDHFSNETTGDDDGGYVEPTFSKNGDFTLTLSYPGETSLTVTWRVSGFKEITYVEDTLTPTNIDNPSSYTVWSGKGNSIEGINSDAVYSGYSMGGSAKFQLKSGEGYIYSAVSGGKISKVTISWNSSTSNGRSIAVYAQNTVPTGLSSFTSYPQYLDYSNGTEITFDTDYAYVCLKATGGACYLNSVTFTWAVEEASDDSLKSIAVDGYLDKDFYFAGESLSANGLTVEATFENENGLQYNLDVSTDVEWTISYPVALEEDLEEILTVTFTASYTYKETTKTDSADFEIYIQTDAVVQLSWLYRGDVIVYAGTTLGDAVDTSKWTFTPTWLSGKADYPSWGTGDDDIHIGLYDTAYPTEESAERLDASYAFKASDDGKYICAFYRGCCSYSNDIVVVTKWRSVIEEIGDCEGTFDFSSGTDQGSEFTPNRLASFFNSDDGLACPTITNINNFYLGNSSGGSLGKTSGVARIGKSGRVTLTFSEGVSVTSITMGLLSWSSSENAVVSITNCDDYETVYNDNHEFTSHTFELDKPSNVIEISTNMRAFIDQITINASGTQDIGKTADCLGLEEYIDNYLHWNDYHNDHIVGDTTGNGSCTNYYYGDDDNGAKAAFNALNKHQRELFSSNCAYADEWARLCAWADANGETLNVDNIELGAKKTTGIDLLGFDNDESSTLIIIIACVSAASLGAIYLVKRKKEVQ